MRLFIYTVIAITMLSANSCNITPADFGSDDDGMMVIQGERKFIIGSYHLPKTDTPFKTLASRGYNYVRVANAREMDTAHENGLYTWVYTKSITLEKEVEDIERIGSLVNEFKEHPALLFWEIEDEPAFKWGSAEPRIPLEQMQRTYDFIKKLDAEHMVITNHGPVNLVSTIQQYNISTDLVACDVYPVIPHGIKPSYALYPDGLQGDLLNPYISQVGEYVDKMRQVVQDKMPVFMVLQGFSWEMLKEKSKQDSSMVLYPTYEESRFMAYNAIVHGANGILYWGTNYTPQPSPFMEDLARVTRELGAMQEVLAAPSAGLNIEKEYHELRYSVDTGVEIMTKEVGDKTYLLTVNSDKNPVKVTFSGLQGFKRANVLEEGRSLEIADGTFTEEYEPFGVHIYQLSTQQDLSDRERAADLTSHLTLEEKVLLLGGMDGMRTNAIPRFGIPSLNLVNGPNGVGDKPGTAFPVGVAMAATWNEELIHEIGVAIGREARAKRADIVLGPCVNIHRTPLGGRNFESYSEDPFLSGRMGVNFVNGVQSQRVATSLKHYALNNQESSRSSYDARLDERALREIYLPAFEMVVKEAQPMTVMAAYNLVRGEHCTQNRTLLTVILREEWGFDGFVMSDWDATHSVVPAVKAGLDLEMPGKPKFFNDQLVEAVKSGLVNEAEINAMVTNVLSLYFKIGVFDDKDSLPVGELDSPQHRALAARTAREAIVLLKNRERLLPLDEKEIKTIAVIGPNASVNRVGGGGSSEVRPFYSVTPLDGLKNRLGDRVDLFYLEGAAIEPPNMAVVESQYLLPPGAEAGEHGLKAEYFNNENMEGEPVVTRVDEMVDFDWGQGSPHEQINVDRFSARWTGQFIAPKTGPIKLGVTSNDGSYLYINNKLVVNNWGMHGPLLRSAAIDVERGKTYDIKIEYAEVGNNARVSLNWQLEREKGVFDPGAVELAAKSDVAIVFAGLSPVIESEGYDRETMDLPGAQDELIRAVAEANRNTIVVINSGTPVTMTGWLEQVPAVIQAWYLGQETGNAVADLLFGDYCPSGKLPVTFPKAYEDHPAYGSYLKEIDRADFEEGLFVGYRYYDSKHVEPLFPFGHGLSYTTFEYSNLKTDLDGGLPVTVSLTVTNSGRMKGSEVVQLYVHDVEAGVERPFKELKGFSKVTLEAGETKTVSIRLERRAFSFYDESVKEWVLEPGEFELLVGASSKDIRLQSNIVLSH